MISLPEYTVESRNNRGGKNVFVSVGQTRSLAGVIGRFDSGLWWWGSECQVARTEEEAILHVLAKHIGQNS